MKEVKCNASSTWSVCGGEREETLTHKLLSLDKKEETSQLDNIIGPMKRNDEVYIHNEGTLWAISDHYPIYARIQEAGQSKILQKREKKKWTGWTPKTEMQLVNCRKKVMEKYDDTEDDLGAIQRTVENATGKVVTTRKHHTKAEREKIMVSTPEIVVHNKD